MSYITKNFVCTWGKNFLPVDAITLTFKVKVKVMASTGRKR